MIKTLYPCFQHWSKRGSVYIISDTHFDDEDREAMGYDFSEAVQIGRLKERCTKNDTLIHLGDVGNPEYMKELNCYKVLIMGNHDRGRKNYLKKTEVIDLDYLKDIEKDINDLLRKKVIDSVSYEFHKPFVRGYKSNNLFDEVYTGPLWVSDKLVLSHEPLCLEAGVTRDPIAFNIHGHDHSGEYYNDDYHLNVCQNLFGYLPMNLKHFIEDGYLKRIRNIHRVTIDRVSDKRG